MSPSGEAIYGDRKVFSAKGPYPGDLEQKTLRVELERDLAPGLYWVSWTTVTEYGRTQRSGKFCYGVGMGVPENAGGLDERDYRWRSYRAVLISGVLLIAVAVFVPRFRRSNAAS